MLNTLAPHYAHLYLCISHGSIDQKDLPNLLLSVSFTWSRFQSLTSKCSSRLHETGNVLHGSTVRKTILGLSRQPRRKAEKLQRSHMGFTKSINTAHVLYSLESPSNVLSEPVRSYSRSKAFNSKTWVLLHHGHGIFGSNFLRKWFLKNAPFPVKLATPLNNDLFDKSQCASAHVRHLWLTRSPDSFAWREARGLAAPVRKWQVSAFPSLALHTGRQ